MQPEIVVVSDVHSFYKPGQPRIVHITWEMRVDFERRALYAVAILAFDRGGEVDLDTRALVIQHLQDTNGESLPFVLHPEIPVLGSRLSFCVPKENPLVTIVYETSPSASGLQWMTPEQAGSSQPFVYSMGECIHTRSFLPCQDTPQIRCTYFAEVTVPCELRAVLAAEYIKRIDGDDFVTYVYETRETIPSYLVAFAVGDLAVTTISPRSCIFALPSLVEAAAKEFADVDACLQAIEALLGPYEWEQYNLLFLPWSFPYGGMENPRVTFLTPTLVAGDKSLVSVVIHEGVHSWTGNMVTNATWSDFWLNEGWTTYVEWRACERLYGTNYMHLQIALRERELIRDIERFSEEGRPEYTALATPIPASLDPDDVFSRVPYCKGALFLMALEHHVGRERFDNYMRTYVQTFRFQSITTKQFLAFTARELPGSLEAIGFWNWVYGPGMPENTPCVSSVLLDEVLKAVERCEVLLATMDGWITPQWVLYLESLTVPAPLDLLNRLNDRYGLQRHVNVEVRFAFHLLAIRSHYTMFFSSVKQFMQQVGRMKYVLPIARALLSSAEGKEILVDVMRLMSNRYHPITLNQLRRIIAASKELK